MTKGKRRFKRYDVDDVRGTLQLAMDLKVLNMSLTGLAIETRFPLRTGKTYSFKIHGSQPNGLSLEAQVQWCQLVRSESNETGDSVPIYQIGLDFQQILDQKAQEILGFMKQHIVVELDRRIFGRFRLQNDENVELTLQAEFEVRRISLSGMLIQAEIPLQLALDEILVLEIDEPQLALATKGRVAFTAERAENEDPLQLGVEFLDLPGDSRSDLDSFIQSLLE